MRTALHNILLLLIVFTTLACNDDKSNIVVTGQVIDEITGKPIPNAEVLVVVGIITILTIIRLMKKR